MKSIHSLHSYPFCSLATNHLQFMFIRASACNWNERKLVLYMIHTHLFWCWVILIRFDSEYCYISNTQQSRLFTTTSTTYLTPVPQSTIEIEKIQMNTKPPTPVDQSNRRLNEAQTSSSTPPHSLSRLTTTTTNLIQQQQQKQPIRRRRHSSLIQFISPSSPSIPHLSPHRFCPISSGFLSINGQPKRDHIYIRLLQSRFSRSISAYDNSIASQSPKAPAS